MSTIYNTQEEYGAVGGRDFAVFRRLWLRLAVFVWCEAMQYSD